MGFTSAFYRLFFLFLLLAVSIVSGMNAYAQKAAMMEPQTSWAVNKVANETNLDQAYCAIAKRFEQATIFTLAKNLQNEASIAIDFQTPRFNPQEGIRVTLDPGASVERTFQILPANEKAIVVRIGQDEDFFKALQKTGFLRIEAGSDSFHFNVADIDEGQATLDQCVTSLNAPVSMSEGENAVFSDSHDDAMALKSEIQSLREETRLLASLLAEAKTGNAAANNNVNNDYEDLAAQLERANREKIMLREEAERARAQLDSTNNDPRMSALVEDNERLRAAILSLEDAVSSKQAHITKLESEVAQSAALSKRVEASQEDWVATMAAARQKIIELETENAALTKEIAAKDAAESARITVLEKDLNAAKAEIVSYQEQIAESQNNNHALKRQFEQSEQKLNKEITKLETQLHEKELALANLSNVSKDLEAALSEKSALEDAIKQDMVDETIVNTMNEKLASLEKENEATKINLSALEARRASLEKENIKLKSKLANAQESEARAVLLQSQLNVSEKKIGVLEAKLKKALELNEEFASLESRKALFAESDSGPVSKNKEQKAELIKVAAQAPPLEEKIKGKNTKSEDKRAKPRQEKIAQAEIKAEDLLNAEIEAKEDVKKPSRKKPFVPMAPADEFLTPAQIQERALRAAIDGQDTLSQIKEQMEDKARQEELLEQKRSAELAELRKQEKMADEQALLSAAETNENEKETEQAQNNAQSISLSDITWNQDERITRSEEAVSQPEESEIIDLLDRKIAKLSEKPQNKAATLAKSPKLEEAREVAGATQIAPTTAKLETSSYIPETEDPRAISTQKQIMEPVQARKPAPVQATYQPAFKIQDIVSAADIATQKKVQLVQAASGTDKAAYSWTVSNVFGSAELRPMMTDSEFDQSVKEYLEKTQERCKGDFAIVPEYSDQYGRMRVDSYDIACVGGDGESSASLLFFNKSGTFTALAHEGAIDDMDAIINLRERVRNTLAQQART